MSSDDPLLVVWDALANHGCAPSGDQMYRYIATCPVSAEHGRSILVVDRVDGGAQVWPECRCDSTDVLDALHLGAADLELAPPNGNGHHAGLRIRALTTVSLRQVEWVWDERVPLGKLTILGGLPGQGKSLLSCWMASHASRGTLAGALHGQPVDVLLVSAEDDPEDTIKPRIMRTGGDLDTIHVVDVRELAETGEYTRQVSLPKDVPVILEAMRTTGARLVVLDPIGGLLDADVDAHKAQHVRRALGPLKTAAEELHVAVVLVHHLKTKDPSTDPLQRLADSHAFVGLPRSILAFGPDPEEEGQDGDRGSSKVLYVAKSNLAGRGEHGLRFAITDGALVKDPEGGVGYSASMELVGPVESSAAESMAGAEERSAMREAMDFLREALVGGPRPSNEVRAESEAFGITLATFKRARLKVCRRSYREGAGPWMMALRSTHEPHAPDEPLDGGMGHGSGSSGASGSGDQGVVLEFRLGTDPDTDEPPEEPGPPGVTPTEP